MVTLEEDANTLIDFGFTYNQAKIYAAITRLHAASVGSISRTAKVRREHVYRTLPKLEKMGLVERILGIPEKIKVIPVEDAFSLLIKKQKDEAEKKVATLTTEVKAFLEHLKQRELGSTPEEKESIFSMVSERDAIMSKAATLIGNAQTEIAIAASRKKLAKFMFFFTDLLKKSLRKNVHIRLLTQVPEEEDALPRVIEEQMSPGKSLELKYTNELTTHYLIADNKEMVIWTSTEADFAECPCLCTNNSSLIALTQKSFADAWRTSMNWKRTVSAVMPDKVVVMRSH
ncbi:MAG TPA: helix-turn-helix domain-containing protein [candidate division Zixibacteria bacterium]|nr:helix-turn-helix domain-containing protein [candidate division Zixibacteria bacterium]